jgi:hypothetical protein
MTPQKTRRRPAAAVPAVFAEARDELLHHIMQCGVIGTDDLHMQEWFNETMTYMADRYHELTPGDLADLRKLGERFCQPPRSQTQDAAAS